MIKEQCNCPLFPCISLNCLSFKTTGCLQYKSHPPGSIKYVRLIVCLHDCYFSCSKIWESVGLWNYIPLLIRFKGAKPVYSKSLVISDCTNANISIDRFQYITFSVWIGMQSIC